MVAATDISPAAVINCGIALLSLCWRGYYSAPRGVGDAYDDLDMMEIHDDDDPILSTLLDSTIGVVK